MDISILIFLGITLGLVVLLRRMRIGAVIAFLIGGIIVGPYGFGFFDSGGAWNYLGETGMIFMWFALGLELNIRRLWSMRRNIFGLGAAQVLAVAAIMFPLIRGFVDWTVMGTAMACLLLAMSNTGAGLQTLADRNELQTKLGRRTFAILLFQDLLAVPLLAMLPIFAGKSLNLGAEVIDVFIMTVLLVIGVMALSRLVLNPLMRLVSAAASREAFLLAILLVLAVMTAGLGFLGLPAGIGAFLTGMLFSESLYNHQVRADIAPFQMLFVSLFFITLGMGLDLPRLGGNLAVVASGVVLMMLAKFCAIYITARLRKITSKSAFVMALILAQGGEFGLLILQTLRVAGIEAIPPEHGEILTAIIIISMMLTPLLLRLYDKLNDNGVLYSIKTAQKYNDMERPATPPAVIICGFGRVGRTLAKMLSLENIPYAAIDMNTDRVVAGREGGHNVFYGDTTQSEILTGFGLAPRTTKAVIIALDNAAVAKKTVRAAKRAAPRVKIFARARNLQETNILKEEGALIALPETIESSFLLGQNVLGQMGFAESEVKGLLSRMRKDNYETISADS